GPSPRPRPLRLRALPRRPARRARPRPPALTRRAEQALDQLRSGAEIVDDVVRARLARVGEAGALGRAPPRRRGADRAAAADGAGAPRLEAELARRALEERRARLAAGAALLRVVRTEVDPGEAHSLPGEQRLEPGVDLPEARAVEEAAPDPGLVRHDDEAET